LLPKHAGAQWSLGRAAPSPAAEHFIDPGPLQRVVRRHAQSHPGGEQSYRRIRNESCRLTPSEAPPDEAKHSQTNGQAWHKSDDKIAVRREP